MRFQRVRLFRLPGEKWLGDDEWLISRRAARIFFLCAICVLALIPLFAGLVDTTKMSFWKRLPWGILGVVGTVGTLFLWLGMWRYWIRLDDSKAWAKRAWFFVMLVGFWFGSVLYYFFVYRSQVIRGGRAEA